MPSHNKRLIIEEFGKEEKSYHIFIDGELIIAMGNVSDVLDVFAQFMRRNFNGN